MRCTEHRSRVPSFRCLPFQFGVFHSFVLSSIPLCCRLLFLCVVVHSFVLSLCCLLFLCVVFVLSSIPLCYLPFLFVVFHSFSCAGDFVLHFL
jgi:hypothetical protein